MGGTRIDLQPAWVLKATPYRDTSLLLECLTLDHGRVGLVARGARGPRTRTRALLQAFRPLLLSWTGRGDLGGLNAVETAGTSLTLTGERVFSGWYLNELLLRLLGRHDPHPGIYQAYGQALGGLAADPGLGEAALRRFELSLLAELGFGLDLPAGLDAQCWYLLRPDTGLQMVSASTAGAVLGRCLIALRDDRLQDPADLRAARGVLRAALAPLLGERVMASSAVLRQLRQRREGLSAS